MPSLSNLADLVAVRNHLRMILDRQYRGISRDDDKALQQLIKDLDLLFVDSMKEHCAEPSAIFYDLKPDEIVAALKKLPSVQAGEAKAVPGKQLPLPIDLDTEVPVKELKLTPAQKKKVAKGKRAVKKKKLETETKAAAVLDAETQEMIDKIAKAKEEVADKKVEPKAIEPQGDG